MFLFEFVYLFQSHSSLMFPNVSDSRVRGFVCRGGLICVKEWTRELGEGILVRRLLPWFSQAALRARCMLPPRVLRNIHHLLSPAEGGPGMCLRRRHVV